MMTKTTSSNGSMSEDELAAFEATSAAIWKEARQPDFDWSTVPLTYISSTTNTVAWCRCADHPNLKVVRVEISKAVLARLDKMLAAEGFTKDGKTIWRKGVQNMGAKEKSALSSPVASTGQDGSTKTETSFSARFKQALSLAKSNIERLPNPVGYVSTSVYLEFQRDRMGASFYINGGIKPGGLRLINLNKLAAEAFGSFVNGYYVFRPGHFTPDLPNALKPDQFHYMRLKEDPRLMPFMFDLIENRIIACLSAWADAANITAPTPSEMAQKAPLRL